MSRRLGLGLLSIGRVWGWRNSPPPDEHQVEDLLAAALGAKIGLFDTAPAYGASEALTGRFLRSRGVSRACLSLATKIGEYWDETTLTTQISHRYDDLMNGLEISFSRLPWIDLLQVHKSNAENVLCADVLRVIDFAKSAGVKFIGASVSDVGTAELVCRSGVYDTVQFPFNTENESMRGVFRIAGETNVSVLVNRPFAMGKALIDGSDASAVLAFSHVLRQDFRGFVLTGTSSPAHLRQNIAAFNMASASCG